MNEEQVRKLYIQSVQDFVKQTFETTSLESLLENAPYVDPYEACRQMVLSVVDEMVAQGFDATTLEELKQRIV